jgi:hypothetical protein
MLPGRAGAAPAPSTRAAPLICTCLGNRQRELLRCIIRGTVGLARGWKMLAGRAGAHAGSFHACSALDLYVPW